MRFLVLIVVSLGLAACPRFHADPLPDATTDGAFVDVDGVHVHYKEWGTGPAIVLIHGALRLIGGSLGPELQAPHLTGAATRACA